MQDRKLAWRLVSAGAAGVLVTAVYTALAGPHSASRLEARLQASADAALVSAKLSTWKVKARGASLDLEGVAASEQGKQVAVEAVKIATGASIVRSDSVAVAPHASPFEWMAQKENGRVVMLGHGPARSTLTAIHEAARKLYGSDIVDDSTLASGAPEGIDWETAAIRGLEALVKLEHGRVNISADGMVVAGVAPSTAEAKRIAEWIARSEVGVTARAEIVGPAEWTATVLEGHIVLQGNVASEEAKRTLFLAAGGARSAEDQTSIAETGAWLARARAALPLLQEFEHGEIAVQGDTFRITGQAPGSTLGYLREDMAKIRDIYSVDMEVTQSVPDLPELRGFDFRSGGKTELAACEAALNSVEATNKIIFDRRRSRITRASGKAMDKVVAIAEACDGAYIEIQGHTDSTGSRPKNLALSRERAVAVQEYLVSRGLAAGRLTAVGFGADRPSASNRTESGRARNRRIEFRVTRGESR